MDSQNSNNSELTEEEMNESSSLLGLAAASFATGIVIGYASMKFMEWNDARKLKKTTNTEA